MTLGPKFYTKLVLAITRRRKRVRRSYRLESSPNCLNIPNLLSKQDFQKSEFSHKTIDLPANPKDSIQKCYFSYDSSREYNQFITCHNNHGNYCRNNVKIIVIFLGICCDVFLMNIYATIKSQYFLK